MISKSENDLALKIGRMLGVSEKQVDAVTSLLDEGCTVPFIARYRKERTGSLDEVAVLRIRDERVRICDLEKRRASILSSCEEQGVLTERLALQIREADTAAKLEDLYLPYRPKRKTRASAARERGLEPLAVRLMKQAPQALPLRDAAKKYAGQNGVEDELAALAGARDIVAEAIAEHAIAREKIRELFFRQASVACEEKKKTDAGEKAHKYASYVGSKMTASKCPPHVIHAMFRGEREGFLKLAVAPEELSALAILRRIFIRGSGEESEQVDLALRDAYRRLLAPAMENELRSAMRERADEAAIRVFSQNARALLMAPPLGGRRVLAVDPGFRTGCKIAVLDEQGALLAHGTIYPHGSAAKEAEAGALVAKWIERYAAAFVAVGNGTAGRETEAWMKKIAATVPVISVSESGASVYSASDVARREFPDLDLTIRGAVSIGRRLQDPLAELVKIDPKSIGVGQYQHDVDQKKLASSLDDVVTSCVNEVGVMLNTASPELLRYVSGLNKTLAENIVAYRNEHGAFRSREALKRVPRLGPKAYEQCAGFLRIADGENPLDASAVHPENYPLVARMAKDAVCEVGDLMRDGELRGRVCAEDYADFGAQTVADILSELAKPGRDPREPFALFSFDESVRTPEDLAVGMKLRGIVTNVADFGVFVDIGVHRDAFIHRSKIKKAGSMNLSPGSVVQVEVRGVDLERGRISLAFEGGGSGA